MTLPDFLLNDQTGPVLEHLTRLAPLGLRFWDPVASAVVGEGLSVSAYLPAQPDQRFQASANRSGVYAFHHLPLLQGVENGAGDQDFWKNLPPRLTFIVEVFDPSQRFLPTAFAVRVPNQGLSALDCGPVLSPPLPKSDLIPLYSAPTRTVPAGMAVVRTELVSLPTGQPAAWAMVEVRAGTRPPLQGLANSLGQAAILFPYPEPQQIGVSSPPGSPPPGRRSLTDQSWPVKIRVFFRPEASPLDPMLEVPDLCQVLKQLQSPPAAAWASLSPLAPLGDQTLEYGKELIISSRPFQGALQPLSKLLITPA